MFGFSMAKGDPYLYTGPDTGAIDYDIAVSLPGSISTYEWVQLSFLP